MTAIDEIKERIDIVDIISETVKLRRTGSNYTGFCPFHENSRTPAFAVFADTGTWKCFGCGEGGDVFTYLMKREGWDFRQTLEYLAERTGVQLEPLTPQKQEAQEEFAHLRNLLEESVLFFRHHLLNTEAGQEALRYLQDRGINQQSIEKFGLGYAPNDWHACMNHFSQRGYSNDDLINVGLITQNHETGQQYDRFRHRVMFAIRDARGKMCGFGARTLDPDGVPKYLNSPQTELFDKGRTLYGLNFARQAIRKLDQAVIVEGYMDVIIPHQAGYENLVSPMGTALSESQMQQLKRLSNHIVLALDPDAAGEKATMRGLEVARQTMDRTDEIVFDARGLLRHEARLQADLRVMQLPEGLDPDEIILRDPQEWQRLIDQAKPIIIHVMDMATRDKDLDDPKIKGEIANQILPLIDDVANPVERDDYRQRLARMLKVDERSLISSSSRSSSAQQARRTPRRRPNLVRDPKQVENQNANKPLADQLEYHILRLLVRDPEAIDQLDHSLQTAELERFQPADFKNSNHQFLAEWIIDSLRQEEMDPEDFLADQNLEEAQSLYREMKKEIPEGEPADRQRIEDLIRSVIRLRLIYTNQNLEHLRFIQVNEDTTIDPDQYQRMVFEETMKKAKLSRASGKHFSID
ncbi:MAG: DNA primase [Anaerolineaceae bacterium]|nr:DNA primase [Anaerolineaceae bacterium]